MSNTRHHMLTLGMAALCLSILMLLSAVSAQCPHQQAGLVNFATLAGANVANSNVVVKQPVKISSSPTVRLRSITVASGGSLIFDNVNLSLNVSFIRVESNASFVWRSQLPLRWCNIPLFGSFGLRLSVFVTLAFCCSPSKSCFVFVEGQRLLLEL